MLFGIVGQNRTLANIAMENALPQKRMIYHDLPIFNMVSL